MNTLRNIKCTLIDNSFSVSQDTINTTSDVPTNPLSADQSYSMLLNNSDANFLTPLYINIRIQDNQSVKGFNNFKNDIINLRRSS